MISDNELKAINQLITVDIPVGSAYKDHFTAMLEMAKRWPDMKIAARMMTYLTKAQERDLWRMIMIYGPKCADVTKDIQELAQIKTRMDAELHLALSLLGRWNMGMAATPPAAAAQGPAPAWNEQMGKKKNPKRRKVIAHDLRTSR